MQIPILNGILTDENADFRSSYPVNMIPVPKEQGISGGYLRPADGIVQLGVGPGVDRGGINWRGVLYRVMGASLVRINPDMSVDTIGYVGGAGQVSMDYSFDRLAIAAGGNLFYWDGISLAQVVDPDLGAVLDVQWVDGYFMTTDGTALVVTELNDPFAVSPVKYGSSEVDPDPVYGLLKIQNEIYALNRHTIEVFDNIGGDVFPFQRIEGAQIMRGVLGTHCATALLDVVAFLGSGRNEQASIYIGVNSQSTKIATREIDKVLALFTEDELSSAVLESRIFESHQFLYVHLPDRTLVYDHAATQVAQEPVWFTLTSGIAGFSAYPARNFVRCYDKWICGDNLEYRFGEAVNNISSLYGERTRWEFGTSIVYNESHGAIFHQIELVSLTGRTAFGDDPTISTSYSVDGETWSQDRYIRVGKTGDREKRLVWLQQGPMRNWRIQRFRGDSSAFISPARLEAVIEPLAV